MLSWLALLAAFIQSPQGASAAATTKHALRPRLHVAPNSLLARALIPKTSMPRKPAQLKSFARADWDVLSDLWHSAGLDDSPKVGEMGIGAATKQKRRTKHTNEDVD
mmetsp:Transcript_45899/g.73833  ORF Transcript_45899/g.73833 Transcript_45899/m.73833 type:complete len:107 (-) Transcript_45899:1778-2098(-)